MTKAKEMEVLAARHVPRKFKDEMNFEPIELGGIGQRPETRPPRG